MPLIVQKFGGTSVKNRERIYNVARIIAGTYHDGCRVVAVVSAQGDTTDDLLDKAHEVSVHPAPREMDMLLATGEQISCALLCMALGELGVRAVSLTGWQAGVHTDRSFMRARIRTLETERIESELDKNQVVVVAGFQGVNCQEDITTLGRGGSDTSAVALACALHADTCRIYTDVEGVYTADPRIVPNARKLPAVSFDEMLELAGVGAQVLNSRSVELAKKYGIALEVLSSLNPVSGTQVKEDADVEGMLVKGVAKNADAALVEVQGLQAPGDDLLKLFALLARQKISAGMVCFGPAGGQDVSFLVPGEDAARCCAVLEDSRAALHFYNVLCRRDCACVSIIGAGICSYPDTMEKALAALGDSRIPVRRIMTGEIRISLLVPGEDADRAVQALHSAFVC